MKPSATTCALGLAAALFGCADGAGALPGASKLDGRRAYALVSDAQGGRYLVDLEQRDRPIWNEPIDAQRRRIRIGADGFLYGLDHRSLVRWEISEMGAPLEVELMEVGPDESWADFFPMEDDVLLAGAKDGALVSLAHGSLGRHCSGPPTILVASSTCAVFCASELPVADRKLLVAARRDESGYLGLFVDSSTRMFASVTLGQTSRVEGPSMGVVPEPNVEPSSLWLAPNQRSIIGGSGVAYVMTLESNGVVQYEPGITDTTIYRLEAGREPERIFAASAGASGWFGAPLALLTGP